MKKINYLVACTLVLSSVFFSCRKTTEKIVDCFGQSLLTSFSHTTDAANPKKVDFTAKHSGELSIASVKFEYGDGQSQTVTGTTASHTYAAAGTYSVKARITLTNGKGTCETDPVRSVTVN